MSSLVHPGTHSDQEKQESSPAHTASASGPVHSNEKGLTSASPYDQARDYLRIFSSNENIKKCKGIYKPAHLFDFRYSKYRCKNPLLCPHCTSQLQSQHRKIATSAAARASYTGMLTLTVENTHDLQQQWDDLDAVWRKVMGGSTKGVLRDTYGLVHLIRTTEVVLDRQSGFWHVHFHCLMFLESSFREVAQSVGSYLMNRWVSQASALAVSASLKGQDYQLAVDEDAMKLAGYPFKANPLKTSTDTSKTLTPADILKLSYSGDKTAQTLWTDLEQVATRRRIFQPSPGLREWASTHSKPSFKPAA